MRELHEKKISEIFEESYDFMGQLKAEVEDKFKQWAIAVVKHNRERSKICSKANHEAFEIDIGEDCPRCKERFIENNLLINLFEITEEELCFNSNTVENIK